MAKRTENGTAYDPVALDATERRFWRDIWEAIPAEEAYLRPNWQRRST